MVIDRLYCRNTIIPATSMLALLLGACSSDKSLELAVEKEMFEYKREKVAKSVDDIPDWFISPPEEDNIVFSSGTSLMPDMQLAVDIARLNAKEQLADRIYSKLRSQTKTYMAKIGGDDFDAAVLNEVEKATKNIVADAEVNGYSQRELSLVPDGIQYRAYVLLAFDAKEAAKIVRNRLLTARAMQSKFQSQAAWRELDKNAKEVKDEERNNAMSAVPIAPVTTESSTSN